MTRPTGVWRGERIATHDPPPKGIPNPIHDDDGQEDVVLAGSCGLGNAAWLGDLADMAHRPGEEPPPIGA
ncbi:hypothetical protein [Candidatus Poriferisodalis sp.]|uniref:hypothetical protein n=1 Tax=Candidatus Poriferisodalis sp. TaxID=3101277 RepID=UPI003B0292ED